jgi:hypothetical protein
VIGRKVCLNQDAQDERINRKTESDNVLAKLESGDEESSGGIAVRIDMNPFKPII